MAVPTVTIDELSKAYTDATINSAPKTVLEGILNDYMDLQYGKETPYTTGKQVLPSGSTIEQVDAAATDDTVEKKFKDIFKKISDTYKSGDLTPQSPVDGWDPKFRPVLVVVTPNKL
ncbi:uncharacterized protein LOC114356866 isoform X3 [Ostrinia furnacalis]|nr:uncharacterized protein LOC114356866 isoform X3 [Ostrinia furnacalis]XP_028166037.1 uncharacterized protein LOC114356866 isoform X3 [Ostrinia furnacalis]